MSDIGGTDRGVVRIYRNDGVSTEFTTTEQIVGKYDGDKSGYSVDISDNNNFVVVGSPFSNINGTESGYVSVYEYDGTNWNQKGSDLIGENAGDKLGRTVAISSEGDVLAIASLHHNNATGKIYIYE